MLLAAALAEQAHAPLMHRAQASPHANGPVNSAPPTPHPRPEPTSKAKSDLWIPPTENPRDPSAILKKFKELEPPPNPPRPWDFGPTPYTPVAKTTSVDLLHTDRSDQPADEIILPYSGGGGGKPAIDPIPPKTPKGYVYDPIDYAPVPGPVHNPPASSQLQLAPEIAVPEPAMMPTLGLLLGWCCMGRKRERVLTA